MFEPFWLNWLIAIGVSMLPIIEIQGSIPFAQGVLKLSPLEAFTCSLLGSLTMSAFLLWALEPVTRMLMRHSHWFKTILEKLFEKTRHKHSAVFNEVGAIFLIGFVAVPLPLPGSGYWSGTLIAFLFGIPFKKAYPLIVTGIVLAGILVTLGFTSIEAIIAWLRG